ncbi:P-loop containing nucleoside triphosphate hydrolase protein [Pholiota molesta]|nr:P-loop containing nucleoside triphosphate hydrolase protein [Pholiota molesta]
MGATGSGKTTFINFASGSDLRVSGGLQSCTNIVQVAQPFMLNNRSVTLIDTPGFDDTTKSDSDILSMIAAFLATEYENGKKLSGLVYIHRISDIRMGGISTRSFRMFKQLCGDSTLQNVVIVTNMWSEVTPEIGEAREAELASQDMFFKPALDKGASLLRHENTRESAHAILQHIIQNRPLSLQIQRELIDEKKNISETAAGAELNRELMVQMERHRREMQALEEEMKEAIRLQDEETRRELEAETQKLQGEMNRIQADAQRLASEYNEEKARLETRMQELSERRSGGLFGLIGRALDDIFDF